MVMPKKPKEWEGIFQKAAEISVTIEYSQHKAIIDFSNFKDQWGKNKIVSNLRVNESDGHWKMRIKITL